MSHEESYTPRSGVSPCRGGRGCTLYSRISSCRGETGCIPRSYFSACREGRGCIPGSYSSAFHEDMGCTPRTCFSACRGSSRCTLRSWFAACSGGRGCTPHSPFYPCRENTVYLSSIPSVEPPECGFHTHRPPRVSDVSEASTMVLFFKLFPRLDKKMPSGFHPRSRGHRTTFRGAARVTKPGPDAVPGSRSGVDLRKSEVKTVRL